MKKITILFLMLFVFVSCKNDKNNTSDSKEPEINREITVERDSFEQDFTLKSEVALSFINGYTENSNKMKESVGVIDWVNANPHSSDELKAELIRILNEAEKQDPEYGLGFDPVFDAQDFPEDGFEIDKMNSNSDYLIVKGKSWKDFKITMKIKKENDKWLVYGVGIINIPTDKQSHR